MGDLYFMPSDVARIVLGYLKESSYLKTYNCFLKECSHLKEIYNLEKAGRSLRKVTQFNLCKILEEWGHHKYSSENSTIGGNNYIETPSSDDTVDETLICDNDVTNSGRKTKARSRSGKKSPQVLSSRRSPCTPKISRLRFKSPRNSSNVPNAQITEETKSLARTPNKAFSEHPQPDVGIELTPKKSPLTAHSIKSTGKSDTSSPARKIENGKINDSEVNTLAEEPDIAKKTSVKSALIVKEKAETCALDGKQAERDTEQCGNCTNFRDNRNKRNVNQENSGDQVTGKENGKAESRFVTELQHGNTKETSEHNINKTEGEAGKSMTVKNTPNACIRTVVESSYNSDANERCLAWLKKNGESVTGGEYLDSNRNIESSGREKVFKNKDDSQSNSLPLQQNNAKLEDVKTESHLSTHIDEASSGGATTSKSSVSAETVRSTTPEITPDTGTSEQSSKQQSAQEIPFHVTPRKMTPEAKDKNLVTPMKLLQNSDPHTGRSPRRKKPKTPRKRRCEVSPVSVVSTKSVDPGNVNPIFEKILTDHRLHEKLAETCNLVHSQIKLANSGKENKSDHVSPVPNNHSYDQETVTASQSLEEILGLDHNFHSEMLSDNIDMSDPAYSSLFKLFGTDRETFNEYLRKEKERELALMEAEVEELERSNHEILCANFGVSNADAGYETQELAYSSPHHVALGSQDLFSTQHGSPQTHVTSTPCGNGVPVSFNPVLREGVSGNSPMHSSNVFGSLKNTGMSNKISPSSTATQPFSPAYSHYSDVNNPPTPCNQQQLSTYVNESSQRGPNTPGSHAEEPYSNPATPSESNTRQVMHSTPTGPGNPDHFHLSSPIHSQHSAVKNSHVPVHCSPLVKADIHPHSPLITHSNGYHSDNNNKLYFNSHITSEVTNKYISNGANNFGHTTGYLHLLQHDVNSASAREPCTTIENTIGCISLPPPTKIETKQNNNRKGASRSRRKKEPVKRKDVTASYTTVKGLLEKPLTHLNRFPLSLKFAGLQRTPEKRHSDSITLRSPGGKTVINVPLLNCEDQIDLSVLGMDENVDTADGSKTIGVYDESLDRSTHYSIAPENQATHHLMNAIEAGKTSEVVEQIQKRKSNETKSKRTVSERKTRARKKREEVAKDEQVTDCFNPSPPSTDQTSGSHDGNSDLNHEIYTATPFPTLHKAATVRALNFGPNVDDPDIAHYRKIYPKFQTEDNSPSVLILNANQVINPGHRVFVNSTPITLVQNVSKQSIIKVDTKINNNKNESTTEKSDITEKENDLMRDKSTFKKKDTKQKLIPSSENENGQDNGEKCKTKEINSVENTPEAIQINSPIKLNKVSNETQRKLHQSAEQSKDLSNKMAEKSENTNEDKSIENVNNREINSESVEECSSEKSLKPEEDIMKKSVSEVIKCKKVDISSKTSKSKANKGKEKLKVKITAKSPKGKKLDTKSVKSGIPFYFKKLNEAKPDDDFDSSDEDVPLSVIRTKKNIKWKKKEQKVEKKELHEQVQITIESESTDEERGTGIEKSTPNKSKERLDGNETNSKEILFEKIGLTPTKSLSKYDLKSPNRANALDVMAEWQRSPLSSRRHTHTQKTRNRFNDDSVKSPTTPRRKQLFTSPIKEENAIMNVTEGRGKHVARMVDKIIDRLKQNNPDRNLDSAKSNRNKKKSRNDKQRVQGNSAVTDNLQNKRSNKISKEKKKGREVLSIQEQKEKVFGNIDENNLMDGKLIEEEEHNNSVIENTNDGETGNNSFVLDENSQSASELHRAVASIEFDQSDSHHDLDHNVSYVDNNENHYNQHVNDEEPISFSSNTKVGCVEISNTCDSDNFLINATSSSENVHSNLGQSDQLLQTSHEQIVMVDVHRSADSQDSNEPIEDLNENYENSRNSFGQRNKQSDSDSQSIYSTRLSAVDQSDNVAKTLDNPNENSKAGSDNAGHSERKSKSKKKKRKHRHCHRHSLESANEHSNVGEQFVSPRGDQGEGERHRHHHKKKKKKSKKRHREEGGDGHESKRRRKEKTNVSLDSLAALNVDEALSQIYGKQT